jgi:hypothetical protein
VAVVCVGLGVEGRLVDRRLARLEQLLEVVLEHLPLVVVLLRAVDAEQADALEPLGLERVTERGEIVEIAPDQCGFLAPQPGLRHVLVVLVVVAHRGAVPSSPA